MESNEGNILNDNLNDNLNASDNKKELEYNGPGYDFYENYFKLPGEILKDIAEFPRQFEDNKWYSHKEIFDKSGAILNDIWLDPDNPNCIVYLDFQPYDHRSSPRELIEIHIVDVRYSGTDVLDNSNKDSSNEYNNKFSNKYKNWNIVIKKNMIYDCPYSRTELNERFLYSRLFLGYDYQSNINDYGEKYFIVLPEKENVLSLKKLCIRNIKLLIADQLDLINEINKSEIILKPLTLKCNSREAGYCKWNPKIIDFHEMFLNNQPEYIKNLLALYEF